MDETKRVCSCLLRVVKGELVGQQFKGCKDCSFPAFNVLLQALNSWLKDRAHIGGSNSSDLVESLNAALCKLGDSDGGADSASCGSEGDLCVVLLLKYDRQ
jgi:hypothetical protein